MIRTVLRAASLLSVGLTVAAGGCQCGDLREPQPWELRADDTGGPLADAGADGVTPDGDAVDTIDIASDAGPDASCIDETGFEVSYFTIAPDALRAPVVTDGAVYSESMEAEGADSGREIVRVAPSTGELETFAPPAGGHDRIVAAASGKVLAARGDRSGNNFDLLAILDGDSEVGLPGVEFLDRWRGFGSRFQSGSVRPFEGNRFGLVLENDPDQAPGWVGYYEPGGSGREIHVGEWARGEVALIPDGLVLSARTGPLSGGGDLEIFAYRGGDEIERVTDTDAYEHSPVSTDQAVFWNTNESVFAADVDELAAEPIHSGTCSPVGADGERAVFSCLSETLPERDPGDSVYGEELYVYDGTETRRVPTDGGRIANPRIDGETVVWAEYEEFSSQQGTVGELRYWHVGEPRAVTVDEIGFPCLGCSRFDPPLNLSIDDGVIAWSYAIGGQPEGEPAVGIGSGGGVAVVERACR